MSHPLLDKISVFKNDDGYVLNVSPANPPGQFVIALPVAPGYRMFIPADQAPAIALSILRAAGFTPTAGAEPTGFTECVETAAGYLDDAVLIASGTAAKAELTRRRDELAQQFSGEMTTVYQGINHFGQNAINTVIQLQDEAAK